MAAESALVGELIWGPIALLANLVQHGLPPSTQAGLIETLVSAFGTMLWVTAAGAVASVFR